MTSKEKVKEAKWQFRFLTIIGCMLLLMGFIAFIMGAAEVTGSFSAALGAALLALASTEYTNWRFAEQNEA